MAITRPTADQLRFNSSANGESILDDYVEACEKGGRSLPDLLDDLFDASGIIDIPVEFREDPSNPGDLQYRWNPTDPWTTFTNSDFTAFVNACATSETNAANSASAASTSETNAANSASAAQTAQTNAEAAEASAQLLFNQFGDQYAGPHINDTAAETYLGAELGEGDIYWNTTENEMRWYTGTAWEAPTAIASTYAANALASQNAAATSESNAATSESNASTSESNAAASAAAAYTLHPCRAARRHDVLARAGGRDQYRPDLPPVAGRRASIVF